MSIYAIFLNEPDSSVWSAIESEWPGRHFILDGRLAFVAPKGITTTTDIGKIANIGMSEDKERLGVIIEQSAISGFNRGDLWEWLRKVREHDGS